MVYFRDASLVRLIHKVETDKSVRTVCLAIKDESDMKVPKKLGYIYNLVGIKNRLENTRKGGTCRPMFYIS